MVHYSNFDRVMDARNHFKNKARLKRGKILIIAYIVLFAAFSGCNKQEGINNERSYFEEMPGTSLYNMAIDNNHVFYFVTSEIDNEAWEKMPKWSSYMPTKGYLSRKKEEIGNFEILVEYFGGKLCFDKNNQLWVLNSSAIYKLDESSFNKTKVLELTDETSGSLDFIAVDNDNNIWAGGLQSGLYKIDNELNVSHYHVNNSKLPTNSMTNIHIDQNNNIWVALWNRGILKITKDQWVVYDNISSQNIWCLVTDKDGHLWVGIGWDDISQSLMRFDGTNWEFVSPRNDKNELVNGTVRRLQSDGRKIYVVSEQVKNMTFWSNELLTFDGVNWNKIYEIPEDDSILDLVVDDYRQSVWITTPNKGIFKIPINLDK